MSAVAIRGASARTRIAGMLAALLLAACGTAPPPLPEPSRDKPPPALGPLGGFEAAQWQRAKELEKQGQLAEAATAWEVLTVLRPDNAGYREGLADLRRQIDTAVADRLQRADKARKRGDLEGASNQYLTALALQPDNDAAADALRAIEKERNRKSYLGTPSRITLRRGDAAPNAAPKAAPAAKAPAGQDRNELEHIAMLSAQGEVDEAIAQLERRQAQDRRDPSARRLLADLYVRKAEKLVTTDRAGAIVWLQKCLRIDPKHARATTLMRQWIDASMGPAEGVTTAAASPAGRTTAPQQRKP